jgi:hypothetical protein
MASAASARFGFNLIVFVTEWIRELLNSAYAGYQNYSDHGQRYLPRLRLNNSDIQLSRIQ